MWKLYQYYYYYYYYQVNTYIPIHNLFSFSMSTCFPLNSKQHGISKPPWGRSTEYLLLAVTVQSIVPPLFRNREEIRETFLGKCPTIIPLFSTATAYLSSEFCLSFTLENLSYICIPDTFIYMVTSNTRISSIVLHFLITR